MSAITDHSATAARTIDNISVCICTFRRPELLTRLLHRLADQVTHGSFEFDIVVVDNDASRSSEAAVLAFARHSSVGVTYDVEPQRNISLTRNRAISKATGSLLAFIDDDECPLTDWLYQLHRTLRAFKANGVLAPVIPDLPPEAPEWLRRGRLLERPRHPTGTRIGQSDARSGNVLLERSLFADGHLWFDPAFGRTGGEDSDFFLRQFRSGRTFVWCDEAEAYESVPPDRWTVGFHIKRFWRSGTLSGEWIRHGRLPGSLMARNVAGLGACAAAMPATLVLPKHLRVRVAQKLAYCAGLVTASFGLSFFRDRD